MKLRCATFDLGHGFAVAYERRQRRGLLLKLHFPFQLTLKGLRDYITRRGRHADQA